MNRKIFTAGIGLLFFCLDCLLGEVAIRNLNIQQRHPWNGLVDIFYTLEVTGEKSAGAAMEIKVSFTGYDEDLDRSIELKTLSGDGVNQNLRPGKTYHTVWNMAEDYPNFHSSAFSVKLSAEGKLPAFAGEKYLVILLPEHGDSGQFTYRYTDEEPDLTGELCRASEIWMRRIPAGTFMMGSPENELGRAPNNEIQHEVKLTRVFYMGIFEVTQYQWKVIMGNSPSRYAGDDRPVESVSYESIRGSDIQAGAGWPAAGHAVDQDSFIGRLRRKTGLMVDLPTDAQWEYACRAGTVSALNSGKELTNLYDDCPNLEILGRYNGNCYDDHGPYHEHTRVGSYQPNQWGLFDMHGNVAEWCLDWYNAKLGTVPVTDPTGSLEGFNRVCRGGNYTFMQSYLRSAARDYVRPSSGSNGLGLRIIWIPEK